MSRLQTVRKSQLHAVYDTRMNSGDSALSFVMALMGLDRIRAGPHDGFTVLHHYSTLGEFIMEMRDCLGREREVKRTYADGSFDCPFCTTAVFAERQDTRCSNPWCPASPYCFDATGAAKPAVVIAMREQIEEAERRQAE